MLQEGSLNIGLSVIFSSAPVGSAEQLLRGSVSRIHSGFSNSMPSVSVVSAPVTEVQQGSSNTGPLYLLSALDSSSSERLVLGVDVSVEFVEVEDLTESRRYCLSSFIEAWCS